MSEKKETSGRYEFETKPIKPELFQDYVALRRGQNMSDLEIAQSLGMDVGDFYKLIDDTINRKDDVKMEANLNMDTVMGTLNNVTKLAANLTEKKDPPAPVTPETNNTTNPNQNVQIKIGHDGEGKKAHKDKEKPAETHIHHDFPESRAMTEEECRVALEKANMRYKLETQRLDMDRRQYEMEFDREEKRHNERIEREEKRWKVRTVVGTILGAVGAALLGYSVWDNRRNRPAPGQVVAEVKPVQTEGKVE